MSTPEQRTRWHRQAKWLAQLGLTPDEPAPVEVIEEVANGVLALLDELADQEWLTRDARECARVLFERLDDPQQVAIVGDASWEWEWLLHSDLTPHAPFPPSSRTRWARVGRGPENDS